MTGPMGKVRRETEDQKIYAELDKFRDKADVLELVEWYRSENDRLALRLKKEIEAHADTIQGMLMYVTMLKDAQKGIKYLLPDSYEENK